MAKLIKMQREESYGKPYTADVHPAEVENFKKGGFTVAPTVLPEIVPNEQTEEKAPQTEEILSREEAANYVFALALDGKTSTEIAAELGLTPQKVMAIKRYDLTPEQKAQLS